MEKAFFYILALLLLLSCGQSEEVRKRVDREQQLELKRQDSLALKIATAPTLDCMPLYVAKEHLLFDTLGVDVRLRCYTSQMDCDTAMRGGSVEGVVSDLVRTERLARQGVEMQYVAATGNYWLLMANHRSRVKRVEQLGDKIIAMTRFSATDWISDSFLKGVKMKGQVYRVQINDVNIRLRMLLNNELDAVWLSEPLATVARQNGHVQIADSRDKLVSLGVVAFRQKALRDHRRQQQLALFVRAYNMACDSLNANGLSRYSAVLKKYYNIDKRAVAKLPKVKFMHAAAPGRQNEEKVAAFVEETLHTSY